ncbi:MAG: ferredoxin family protein [Muribaculaceae bacterium]
MAKVKGAIVVNEERCKGCGICVAACPFKVLALQQREVNNKGYHYAYMETPEQCTGCTSCATVCPDSCIEVYRVTLPNPE